MRALVLPLLLLAAPAVAANPFEDLDRLERRLVAALDADIGQPGGPAAPIDRRMKLAACPKPAEIDPPAMGAVAIRCVATGWRIRVPIQRLAGSVQTASYQPQQQAMPVIRRGDPVELQAALPGMTVSSGAIAQEDGGIGARIRVKTDPKNPPIFAEIVDAGIVRVPGFK
ncbi:flagella basal body P-ring formation protein FlgA [Sphingomonas naphthae]|uniref:Flagella basal body P-ring formation protein FlgA n=1 Tax=Sphingomonas naphthae TaxID=1813468 RepID=A0ABY7TK81_9SPHN|nr:flagella basal body P-ring formation protein FlgA [Sphingomonas naphthae]WCT73636.1 flagella basal body P-ring formation protein FlgA [Sphingomonas naphthae]